MKTRTNLHSRALTSKPTFPREQFDVRRLVGGRGKGGIRRRKYVGRSGTAEGRAPVLASREAALLHFSLVPEVAEAVGEMLARAARGTGALLLRVRTRQPSSEARDRDPLGLLLGRSGILTLGKDWGHRSWSPRESFSGDPWGSRFREMPSGEEFRVPRRVLSLLSSFSRAPCRLLAAFRAAPPLDCPGTP